MKKSFDALSDPGSDTASIPWIVLSAVCRVLASRDLRATPAWETAFERTGFDLHSLIEVRSDLGADPYLPDLAVAGDGRPISDRYRVSAIGGPPKLPLIYRRSIRARCARVCSVSRTLPYF